MKRSTRTCPPCSSRTTWWCGGVNTTTYTITAFNYDPTTRTGVWTLQQTVTNDKLRLILDDALVGGLDGEWADTTDAYPSGDGTAMYTRSDRKVTTPGKLKAQIAVCNAELATNYFPDEEEHIAAYLNLRYYKFKD